jgi:hypothetical protein
MASAQATGNRAGGQGPKSGAGRRAGGGGVGVARYPPKKNDGPRLIFDYIDPEDPTNPKCFWAFLGEGN